MTKNKQVSLLDEILGQIEIWTWPETGDQEIDEESLAVAKKSIKSLFREAIREAFISESMFGETLARDLYVDNLIKIVEDL